MRTRIFTVLALLLTVGLMTPSATLGQRAVRPTRLQNLPRGLTEAQIRAHVIAPEHTRSIQIEEVDPKREVLYRIRAVPKRFRAIPHLDVAAFGASVHAALKDNAVGYILQVRQNGQLIHIGIWNWSQMPVDANQGWTEDTRMNVGSVSKFLTAVGLVKLLDAEGISYDAKIIDYLPTYWAKGPNIDQITFRHLMTHRSGFSTGKSSSDYVFMKGKVAAGVAGVGAYDYENMNFGLCRILMPIINGDISKATNVPFPPLNRDVGWDAVTLHSYRNYMQANVFTPAGVSDVGFAPPPIGQNALAYPFPPANKTGWNSGDLATMAGGAGWRLSCKELLNVLDHVRRRNTIISSQKAQYMLDNHLGIDQTISTPAGKIYNKNGSWGKGGKTEQCVAYFLPGHMEVVVFVNSPIGTNGFSLRGIVKDVFISALKN